MSQFFKKNWKRFLVVIILVILIVVIVGGKKDVVMATHTVARQDVSDTLVLSGKVEPVERVEMAFAGSGIIDGVFKKNGDTVRAGERIVELDNASLRADLADITAGSVNKEQDLLIANARKKLLNDDLAAYLVSNGDDDLSASVTGSYQSLEEGTYYLNAYASGADSGFSLKITGLENTTAPVNFNSPVAVGKRGLFIQFNNTDTSYMGSSWIIEIPNKRGSNYISNLNAYESAQKTRDIEVAQTSARVAGIQADIEARTLRAPFNGVVSKVEARKGEIASAGEVVATIISKDNYRVKVQVPEVDIVNLLPGLIAEITLDAYGKDVIFPAKVVSVDQSETKVDGVSVYEADILFDTTDPRILSGLSANVSILKSKKEAVLCVPARFIDRDGSQEFVLVQNLVNETNDKTFVVTGLRGSDGCVEIITGLNEGDVVVGDFEK
jgi:multidrug efflux pump subunit AcrA (membrane-fusion protein)